MHAIELVTVGDELLLGFTVDTNSAWLARRLAELGIVVTRRTAVGDERGAIAEAVREALARTGAVITTGGLGPTADDVTREAIADVFGVDLVLDEEHVAWMQARWQARYGREMPASNRRQALLPRGARKISNAHGSAPGAWIENERGQWVVMLPGVPREMRGMVDDSVLAMLRERADGGGVLSLTIRTTGRAESLIQDELSSVALGDGGKDGDPPLSLAYLPGIEGVDLRLTVRAKDLERARAVLRDAASKLRARLGDCVYGEDNDDLARLLLDQCRARAIRIAVAESCTGGMLGERLTSVPGSSDVFLGGVIAYDDSVKIRDLGVPAPLIREHGAVSGEVVRAMAEGVVRRFDAGLGLAITGVAGPGGGTPDKPVGLVWIGVALNGEGGWRVEARRTHSWGDRQEVRYRATQSVMDLARRLLARAQA